ncbi:hypothetical protein Fcan01_09276 [Folsomia candida]|uniref:Uncharacterized protein n=1 Tax=Folsomia candida TaxID=158441 RepID=A0A226EF80_FOLCA|nr:hypothetical protein Fcan01_09276 [Folsomia candida]
MIRKIGFLVLPLFCCGIDLVNGRKIVVSGASSKSGEDGIDPDSFQMMLNHFQNENLRYHLHACECSGNNKSANAESLDCSRQASSEWEPPNCLMPEKPGGLKSFILKMHEGNTSFCPLDNFTSILVSLGGSPNDQYSPKILDENGTLQIFDDIFGLSPPRKIKKSGYCIIRKKGTIIFNICTHDVPEAVDPSSSKSSSSPTSASSPIANISNYVKKCCNFDQIMDGNNPNNCITVTNKTQWWYPIYYRDGHRLRLHHSHELPNPTIVYGFPTCSSYIIESFRDNKFPNLQENGDVILVDEKAVAPKKKHTPILAGQFCIDGIYIKHLSPNDVHEDELEMMQRGDKDKDNQEEEQIYTYSGSEWHQGIIVCTPEDGNKHAESPSFLYPLYAAVNHTAALFLLLTAVVYILLWSHHNIHGWLQFSYVVSLFFAFSFLAIIQVWSQVFIDHWPRLCYNLGNRKYYRTLYNNSNLYFL